MDRLAVAMNASAKQNLIFSFGKLSTSKKLIITMWIAAYGSFGPERLQAQSQPSSLTPLVWCGLDYSKVKMIGTLDFRQPDKIFPAMLVEWNGLFMKEMLPQLESMAKNVVSDLKAVADANEKATARQIIHEDGTRKEMVDPTHINDADIAVMVRDYRLKNQSGLGLVFIVDRLVKAQETGCTYVVFFDVSSRRVLASQRFCNGAGGFGFRNYWFHPIKGTVRKLPAMYKKVKATKP